jgi:hypothetical protein
MAWTPHLRPLSNGNYLAGWVISSWLWDGVLVKGETKFSSVLTTSIFTMQVIRFRIFNVYYFLRPWKWKEKLSRNTRYPRTILQSVIISFWILTSPANLHSTNCSTITLIYHLGLYNRPEVATVPGDVSPPPKKKKTAMKTSALRYTRTGGGGSIPGRGQIFLFSTASRPALGPTQPPDRLWVPPSLLFSGYRGPQPRG